MPGENPILLHWHTEVRVFQENLSSLKQQLSEETIHDIRVAIKKLRSYLKLVAQLVQNGKSQEIFEKTKKLFDALGKHRNIQVTRNLLPGFISKDEPILNPLLLHLQLLQDQIANFCMQVINDYNNEQLNRLTEYIDKDIETLKSGRVTGPVTEIVESKIKIISHDLRHFRTRFHLIRKNLKDIFYWSKIFEEEVFFKKSELKDLDKVLDHLGSIQDHEILRSNLKYFRKTILSPGTKEFDLIKNAEEKIACRMDQLLEKAHHLTRSLLHKEDK